MIRFLFHSFLFLRLQILSFEIIKYTINDPFIHFYKTFRYLNVSNVQTSCLVHQVVHKEDM